MSAVRAFIVSALAAAALSPLAAMAANEYHPAPGEAGVKKYPEHRTAGKSRSEVKAEAQKDNSLARATRGEGAAPAQAAKPASAGKTREQVKNEAVRASKAGEIVKGD